MKTNFDNLHKAFENRIRLGIMSMLLVNDHVDFSSLKEMLKLTDGNLASHLKALEKIDFIKVKKEFVDRKPNTKYYATPKGRKAFEKHLDVLEQIIKSTA